MVISSFYNKERKVLLLSTTKDSLKINLVKDGDVVKLYNEKEELVAVNIFNYDDKDLNQGIVNNSSIQDIITKYYGENFKNPYIVGQIVSLKKHPKSEKLNICQVNLGDYEEQIVCGASNVGEGIKVIVSQVGAVMPSGLKIKPSKLIDEKSNGMITSLNELGLSPQTGKGIAILEDSYVVGQAYER